MPLVVHRRVRALTLERQLPFIMPWRAWEGGDGSTLIAYGPHFPTVAKRTAARADEVLD